MPQAVQVETQSEQQGLARLHPERAAGCASRELALHRREHRFDQGAAPVELSRERPPHFGTHSAHSPSLLPTLGWDHALGPELSADISVIPLAVELGVGQHHSDARLLGSRFDHRRQISRSRSMDRVARSARAGTADPNPPRSPTSASAARAGVFARDDACAAQKNVLTAPCAKPVASTATRARRRPRRRQPRIRRTVSSTARSMVWPSRRCEETVHRREVGHTRQSQRLTQFAVLAQPHLGFAKGPVLVAHQSRGWPASCGCVNWCLLKRVR